MRGGRGGADTVSGIVRGFAAHHLYVLLSTGFAVARVRLFFCIKFSYVKHNAYIRVV